jgi:Zn-dependent peptidase ImmA (M78 family)
MGHCCDYHTSREDRFNCDANKFARAILMPEKQFKEEVRKDGDVLRLAQLFKTSTIAIRLRAKELGMRGHYI